MDKNLVSIIMPLYNGGSFIREALNGILSQTYQHFELIIIDDGSTDNSLEIVNSFSDSRIHVFTNEVNKGLIYTRNLGFQLAKGEYIAFNDCDDISFSERLEVQINFFLKNKDIGICGSSAIVIDTKGSELGSIPVVTGESEFLKCLLLFSNIFINSSLILRRNIDLVYQLALCEDYDLTERLVKQGVQIANINEQLVKYRIHQNNISILKRDGIILNELIILKRQLGYIGIYPSDNELKVHHSLTSGDFNDIGYDDLKNWINRLDKANDKLNYYKPHLFKQVLFLQLYKFCKQNKTLKSYMQLVFSSFMLHGLSYLINKRKKIKS